MCNIKEGDVVVCINNGVENDTISSPMLTLDKSYVVIKVEPWQSFGMSFIIIKNDVNISYGYHSNRFKTLSEYRKLKLERLSVISG